MNKEGYFILFLLLFISCKPEKKDLKQQENVQEEINIDSIIKNQNIDAFPLFTDCENKEMSLEEQKMCFINYISQKIYNSLNSQNFESENAVNDTIFIKMKVDTLGSSHLVDLVLKEQLKEEFPKIDSILIETIELIPPAKPATARGTPTNLEFEIPIIIKN